MAVDDLAMHSLAVGAHRLFIYVNPFEHAEWTGKVDGAIVSGPGSVFANSGNLPTPVPEPSASTLNPGAKRPPVVPKYDLATLGGESTGADCDATLDNQKAIEACHVQANNELDSLVKKVGLKADFVGTVTANPYGLYQVRMKRASDDYADLLSNKIDPPNASDIGPYLAKAATIVGTARTLSRTIAAIPDWPKAETTRVTGHFALLAQVIQSCDDCLVRADATAPKGGTPDASVAARRGSLLRDITKGRNHANTVATYQTQYDAEQASLKAANDNFVSKLSVAQFGFIAESNCNGLFSGGREKTVTVTFSATESVALKLVCVSRMFTSYGIAFSASGTHNYTANSLPPTPLPAATPTPAGTPSPVPAAQIITTVTDNGPGKYRPIFVTLAHFALTERHDLQPNALESGFFGTIGVGATTSTNSQNPIDLDFLYGLSYAKYRSVVLTLGQHYGKEQQLAPGYFIGQQLTAAPTSAIPTVSLYHFRPFFSLTFGKQ